MLILFEMYNFNLLEFHWGLSGFGLVQDIIVLLLRKYAKIPLKIRYI